MKITCDIIRDLLPSYVDHICSEDSCNLIQSHIQHCEACKRELERMCASDETLPLPDIEQVEAAQQPFRKIKKKNRLHVALASLAAVLLTSCFFYVAACLADNVDFIRDYFHPQIFVTVSAETPQTEWTALSIPETGVLQFSSLFSSKEVVNYADSGGSVTIRILDENGNIVVDETIVESGQAVSLDQLKRNQPYYVETKCPAGGALLVFD